MFAYHNQETEVVRTMRVLRLFIVLARKYGLALSKRKLMKCNIITVKENPGENQLALSTRTRKK